MHCRIKEKILLWGQKQIEKGAWFLAPLSLVWGLFSFCKNKFYDWGWFPVEKVDCPVISVGNIVAGGTGKTPLVHLLSLTFAHHRVAILSRGYGRFPDEPLLLQRRLKNAKVYVGKDRVKLARKAATDGAELIILDDGFQYRKLFRDFDLVLLSGSDPFGKGHYLPWGFLRDSPKRISGADSIFVSGRKTDLIAHPHIGVHVKVEKIVGTQRPIDSIDGWKVAMFCGIAKPHLFKKSIEDLGAQVVLEWVLADHERAPDIQLQKFADKAKALGAKGLVCTEKDFVKLEPSLQTSLPVYFLEITLKIREGISLWENLIAKIGEKIDNRLHD